MKALVSYMFRANTMGVTYGHMNLEMQYWDTKAVTEKLGEILNVDPTTVILTGVFEIPAPRFSQEEKDKLKNWMQLAYEYVDSEDEEEAEAIRNLIKELNE